MGTYILIIMLNQDSIKLCIEVQIVCSVVQKFNVVIYIYPDRTIVSFCYQDKSYKKCLAVIYDINSRHLNKFI